MITITGRNAPELFRESLFKMRTYALEENSRNGPVRTILTPVVLRLRQPDERVITDPTRDANPFFHVMEFIWMMAGSDDIRWIAQFNKNMMKYSDDGIRQWAAYGHRWRHNFDFDQIDKIIWLLKKNPLDRRLVINMWDPYADLGYQGMDVPCNTQLLFRVVDGELQMSVINRSNDLIWGALGANICHMTMLHELIARAAGLLLGEYYVFTQNLHIYESVPNFEYYMHEIPYDKNIYLSYPNGALPYPLLQEGETYTDFVADCEDIVGLGYGQPGKIRTNWMRYVGSEIYAIWLARKLGKPYNTKAILADDWRIACEEWIERRRNTAVDNQRDYNHASVDGREQTSKSMGVGVGESGAVGVVDSGQCDVGSSSSQSSTDCSVSS